MHGYPVPGEAYMTLYVACFFLGLFIAIAIGTTAPQRRAWRWTAAALALISALVVAFMVWSINLLGGWL